MSVLLLGAGKGGAGAALAAPITITSSATFSAAENQTAVATLTASGGTGSYTWSKIGGADTAKFTLTSGGVLTFATAPDFEAPTDADANNIYLVQVQASDGVGTPATQNVSVTVTDVVEVVETWNPSDKSANITLSNGDLTAQATTSSDGAVRSLRKQTAGKFYFEVTRTGIAGGAGGDTGFGIATSAAGLGSVGATVLGAAELYLNSGGLWVNGTNTGITVGTVATGSVVCFAIDLTNSKIWVRIGAGNWNGIAGNDPATNTGGGSIAALFPTNAAYALASFNLTVPLATINFGNSSFAQAVPSGFSAWKATSV